MLEITYNKILKTILPSPIRSFNDQISHIDGIRMFTLGEPDFDTPDFIKEEAILAIQTKSNGYTHSRGMLDTRIEVQKFLNRHFELTYNPESEIILTVGATEAIYSCLFTLTNSHDKVLIASPHYSMHVNQIQLVGAEPVIVDVSQDDFKWTPNLLDDICTNQPDIKGILLNHPSNPTGKSYTAGQLEALAKIIEKHNLWVISDEIYGTLTYDFDHVSMAKFLPERTLLVNGLSKSHAMTGWRLGFVAGPEHLMEKVFIIHQGLVSLTSAQSQFAATAALGTEGDPYINKMKGEYQQRRDYLIEELKSIGYQVSKPQGAFYLFIKVPDWFPGDDFDFCLKLAQEAKLGVIPGQAFGLAGKGYFRLSYASSMQDLAEFIRGLTEFTYHYQ